MFNKINFSLPYNTPLYRQLIWLLKGFSKKNIKGLKFLSKLDWASAWAGGFGWCDGVGRAKGACRVKAAVVWEFKSALNFLFLFVSRQKEKEA